MPFLGGGPSPTLSPVPGPVVRPVFPARRGALLRRVAVCLALAAVVWPLLLPGRALAIEEALYSWRREVGASNLVAAFDGRETSASEHFVLHYQEPDRPWAPLVLEALEEAREACGLHLGAVLTGEGDLAAARVTVLLHPTPQSLSDHLGGWSASGFEAAGAYWAGVIHLVSPRVWLGDAPGDDASRRLRLEGTFLHEYTHWVVDHLVPAGRYPRWLSEGLAQYLEYVETGYLWRDPAGDVEAALGQGTLYSLRDLDRFGDLTNAALAYREAFLLVAYIVETRGSEGLQSLLGSLARGHGLASALRASTGLSLRGLEEGWLVWLKSGRGPGRASD